MSELILIILPFKAIGLQSLYNAHVNSNNVGINLIKKKLNLILFIWRSRRWILREFGGPLKLMSWAFANVLENDVLSMLGDLCSRSAYIRRADPVLYGQWIQNIENIPVRSTYHGKPIRLLIFQSEINRAELEVFFTALSDADWLGSIHLIGGDASYCNALRVNAFSQLDLILQSQEDFINTIEHSAGDDTLGYLLLHTLCEFSTGWLSELIQLDQAGADLIFFDHDFLSTINIIDPLSKRVRENPNFKPGYSRELLFDPSYAPVVFVTPNLMVKAFQRDICLGDYPAVELIRACFAFAEAPKHLPRIFTHLLQSPVNWRCIESNHDSRGQSRSIDLSHEKSSYPERYAENTGHVSVSIIIPIRDKIDLLVACLDSIKAHKSKVNTEVIIMNNQSKEPRTLAWLARAKDEGEIVLMDCDYGFNWSRLCNDGIGKASGDVIVLLNNDTLIITPDWLDRLVGLALERATGVVGPLLLYPDNTIQHAGIVVGYGGFADHVFSMESIERCQSELFVSPLVRRHVSACTGACLVFTKSNYAVFGPFDESLTVAGDLDFCINAINKGYDIIFDPAVRLYHLESKTRRRGLPKADQLIIKPRIQKICDAGDPYYNTNLSLSSRSPMMKL